MGIKEEMEAAKELLDHIASVFEFVMKNGAAMGTSFSKAEHEGTVVFVNSLRNASILLDAAIGAAAE